MYKLKILKIIFIIFDRMQLVICFHLEYMTKKLVL